MKNDSLRDAVSKPETKRPYTRRVFSTIADRYDLVCILLSFNQDQKWKHRMVMRAGVKQGDVAIDLACGTGDITLPLAREGARAIGLDITGRMLELARDKAKRTQTQASFVLGDMIKLPFPDASADLITTGYGIRNVPDISTALGEIHRVLKPGGRMMSLDFNRPPNWVVRTAYLTYLSAVGSALGWVLHRDPDTYRYIPETIRIHPGAKGLNRLMETAGFTEVRYRPVFGGFMALHTGTKPVRESESPTVRESDRRSDVRTFGLSD